MILELIKRAGQSELTLSFTDDGTTLTCEVLDSSNVSWYSISSTDKWEVITTINDYISDPVAFSQRYVESVGEVELITVEA